MFKSRHIKVKVEHCLLFMFSPPKISWVILGIRYICLHFVTVFYLIQPSSKQIICFDFGKQNSVLPKSIPCTLVQKGRFSQTKMYKQQISTLKSEDFF
jgi:hypothetical protein